MPTVAAHTPPPTPEYQALEPQGSETPMDALARVGDEILQEFGGGDESKDSRKNKKMPKQLATLVCLRAQGFDNAEIAKKLGVSPQKLTALITKARKDFGWSDLGEKLAHVAVPKAVDNVIKHLDAESSGAALATGQHLMTRTLLAGVGVFRSHSAVKQTSKSENFNIMRIEISGMPQHGMAGAQDAAGSIPGVLATPRRALSSGENAATSPASPASIVEGEVIGA